MIETNRLILKPLTYQQMLKYIKNDHSLEADLKLNNSSMVISPLLKEALEKSILPSLRDENKNYLTDEFLKARMNQSLAVDETLGRIIRS